MRTCVSRLTACCLTIAALVLSAQMLAARQTPSPNAAAAPIAPRALLDKYCVTCHNEKLKTAGLMLDSMDVGDIAAHAEVWEKVIKKLRLGTMPPAGMPRPDQATTMAFVKLLETTIDAHIAEHPNPGRTEVAHRLNRAEYQNAVRDLLAVDLDVTSLLPGDDSGQGGFDNMADVLTVSPALLEQYLSVATKIARAAVGPRNARPQIDRYTIPQTYVQDDRMSEGLPFGSFGGLAIPHYFPTNGEYSFKIRLQRTYNDCIRGMRRPHQLEVRIDGLLIKQFKIGGEAPGKMNAPVSICGRTISTTPNAWDAYMHEADNGLELRVPVLAGTHQVSVSFARDLLEPEGVFHEPIGPNNNAADEDWNGYPAVEHVFIGGPYDAAGIGDTASRRKIFTCRPTRPADEARCASTILSTLARRAYRRPPASNEVKTLLTFYQTGRKQGDFEAGIELALQRLLVDPSFLFRFEADPPNLAPGALYRISDLAMASRLSFFLWSSGPDDELLDLAIRGKLSSPKVLEQQARRMLSDKRSKALVDNFVGQWLVLRNVRELTPDPNLFDDFDHNLRDAFQQETALFVESQLREDRGVLELLTANYTYVNERLARHYGIPNVYGSRFRRITYPDDRRSGILGHAGLLAVTSYPDRTSPVLRGRWILDTLLGAPPPPPPPNVNNVLPAKGEGGKPASVRERLDMHRRNPACAVCHSQMDPLGFALENFDAIGRWRTSDEGNIAVDPSGVFGGTKFEGLAGLRSVLLDRHEEFVATIVEKLLAYSLGRPAQYYDRSTVRKIMRDAAPGYRWSSIILGIVQSTPFQKLRSPVYAH